MDRQPRLTAGETFINAVIDALGAAAVASLGTYTIALVAAPFQQRNALRDSQERSRAKITELEATPVAREHGDQLRRSP